MNPFRFIIRITEFLAGPPVHEELHSLQEHCEGLRQQATSLEAQRDELKNEVAILAEERKNLKRFLDSFKAEREKLKQQRQSEDREKVELKQRDLLWNIARVESVSDASDMSPGTFALLNPAGGTRYWADVGGPRDFGHAQKGVYDPIADQVLFSGGTQQPNRPSINQLLRYDIAAKSWSTEVVPRTWEAGPSYDTNAINPLAREMYVSSKLRPNTLRRLNLDTGLWSSIAQPDKIGFIASEPSAEYFPERDELLWLQGKKLGAWTRSSNSWRLISPTLSGLGSRAAIARYNPVDRCVLILGGANTETRPETFSHAVYRYDENGAITRMADSPPSIKVYVNRAVAAVDPSTGDLIIIQAVLGRRILDFTGQIELWKYSIDKDTWTQLDESLLPTPSGWWAEQYPSALIATPISKYGVILFMSFAGAKSSAILYKHPAEDDIPHNNAPSLAGEITS